LQRHTGAAKDGGSTENVRVPDYAVHGTSEHAGFANRPSQST
jgi:hypothetical protein